MQVAAAPDSNVPVVRDRLSSQCYIQSNLFMCIIRLANETILLFSALLHLFPCCFILLFVNTTVEVEVGEEGTQHYKEIRFFLFFYSLMVL